MEGSPYEWPDRPVPYICHRFRGRCDDKGQSKRERRSIRDEEMNMRWLEKEKLLGKRRGSEKRFKKNETNFWPNRWGRRLNLFVKPILPSSNSCSSSTVVSTTTYTHLPQFSASKIIFYFPCDFIRLEMPARLWEWSTTLSCDLPSF